MKKGIASLAVVLILVIVVMGAAALYYFKGASPVNNITRSVQNVYMPDTDPAQSEISESDDPADIEAELDATDMGIGELEDDLDALDTDIDSL